MSGVGGCGNAGWLFRWWCWPWPLPLSAASFLLMGLATVEATSATEATRGSLPRVAEILELEEDTVADAMEQARQEMHDERVEAWLDKMVESGKITQEQADDYQDWLDDQPEGLDRSWGKGFGGHHWFHGRGLKWDKHADTADSGESDTDSTST